MVIIKAKTSIGITIMTLLLLQSFAFQRIASFSVTKSILRSQSRSISLVTTQAPILLQSVQSPCMKYEYACHCRRHHHHRHQHQHGHRCRHHYSKTNNEDYPILPIETIQQSIGENRTIASEPFTWDELTSIILEQKDVSLLSRSLQMQSNYIRYTNKVKEEWVDMNDCIVYTKFGDCCKENGNENENQHPLHDDNENDNDNDVTIFQKVKDAKTNKYKIKPSIQQTKEENIILYKLLPNDYPYYVTSDIQHYCLWKLNGSITEQDIENAILELTLGAEQDVPDEITMIKTNNNNGNCDAHGDNNNDNNVDNDDFNTEQKLGKVIDTISWINPKHLQSIPDIDHAQILCLRDIVPKMD